jgi:hypothetical protein
VSPSEYVALAYGVAFAFVLVYVAIIAAKLARLERETAELLDLARGRNEPARGEATVVEAAGEA